ncbi:hypothetical protein [Candidatus Magnetominusculus xianensis]|uniref:DUF948 domain-containing protein n=1 Tax=Candidatus Magnetominusculus xianensis TaxID=1748249 RepID=A0ABR5SJ29_9BACT|nr:hypothetical protein [Candidatus Magnetominusculus xianensis]KWT93548.1 hypothetical protein ASN18_0298 [Candidatus Magnetominusculus xianensis]MBF0405684.1 hypothetical protein [Nitrospirota bacterium]
MDIKLFALWAVVVLCSVPILIQIARMIGSIIDLIKTTSCSIRDFSGEVVQTVKIANSILSTVDDMVVGIKELISSLKELGTGAKKLGETLKESSHYVTKLLGQLSGLIAVIKSTIGIFIKGATKKGDHDERE